MNEITMEILEAGTIEFEMKIEQEGFKGEKGDTGECGLQGSKGTDGLTTEIELNGVTHTQENGKITLPNQIGRAHV